MNFREATDSLLASISHAELARALGVSVATVRQARLDLSAKAHRSPPEGWEKVIARMAEERTKELDRLVRRFKRV